MYCKMPPNHQLIYQNKGKHETASHSLISLTFLGHIQMHSCRNTVAGTARVVTLVLLAGIGEGELALGGHLAGGVGGHLHPALHVVVDHPVVVIPEDVLGRGGGGVQDTGQRYGRPLVHMILLPSLDIRLWIHNIEMNSPGDCSC